MFPTQLTPPAWCCMQSKTSADCRSVHLVRDENSALEDLDCWEEDVSQDGVSLLGQQGVTVGLHLLQTFGEVVVTDLQLVDPVQSRAELQGDENIL